MMNVQSHASAHHWRLIWFWRAVIFGVLLLMLLPLCANRGALFQSVRGTVWAQAAIVDDAATADDSAAGDDPATKPCSSCHSEEHEAWQRSVHAVPDGGATCTDCHGAYVRGHPDEGTMSLVIDSSNCATCHTDTFAQWEHSLHAGENVQCIGCHSAHSQDLRLTDDKLCRSCHRESLDDSLHSAHWQSEVACTSCHLTDGVSPQSLASRDPMLAVAFAPTHDFVTVSAAKCLDCHREDVEKVEVSTAALPVDSQALTLQTKTGQPSTGLATKLQSAEKNNHFLTVLSTINLGFGIGVGGILGILFVMVATAISKRSDRL